MENFEIQAINTAGLWYAYVKDRTTGELILNDTFGFLNRDEAIAKGKAVLAEHLANKN